MSIEKYLKTLHKVYDDGTNNHEIHNDNPDYWAVLLGDIKDDPAQFEGKTALDFGCGKGRNVTNMLSLAKFARADGVDISRDNIEYCIRTYTNQPSQWFMNNGKDLSDLRSNEYDFVMSTIVFQHLCVHELRYELKQEIYRVMKPDAIFSFQMGYGPMSMAYSGRSMSSYYENNYDALGSNSSDDVRIDDEQNLIDDLTEIGFTDITFKVLKKWTDHHPYWIYVRCIK